MENDHFLLVVEDRFENNIYVTHFPSNLDICQFESEIMTTFESLVQQYNTLEKVMLIDDD